jgi:hypothetical protein
MSKWVTTSIASACALTASVIAVVGAAPDQSQGQEPPMAGIHWARGQKPAARPQKSPNLLYHGGPVMHGTFVEAILWGTSWSDSAFVADKVTGLSAFYSGIGGSDYGDTNTEYSDAAGPVSSGVTFGGIVTDLSASVSNGSRTSPILAEVCAAIGTNAVPNGFYPVYVDAPRGHSRFCAWHSAGTCPNGTTVQFAFFYNLDGDPGCDPQDASGLHSQGMAALANVSGHETSEMLTDPRLNAWYDANGQENADKCAWSFGTLLLSFSNRSAWKIQGNWSNAAFNAGTGFANSSGQNGCIDGGNFK